LTREEYKKGDLHTKWLEGVLEQDSVKNPAYKAGL
jgi:hypothetical protein